MKLARVEDKIASIPLIIKQNRESLICLNSQLTILDGNSFIDSLDNRFSYSKHENVAIISGFSKCKKRFPTINIREPFWLLDVNKILPDKFDLAKKLFLKQSDVKNTIVNKSKNDDFIILIIVDGLSYIDCLNWRNVRPCLVDTVSTTEFGFKNIVGTTESIPFLLFKNKFKKFIGFSYWDRDNELTDVIFRNCHNLLKVQRFSDIIDSFHSLNVNDTYIQIVLNGLDSIAHRNRDEPLIEAIVDRIYSCVNDLANLLINKNIKGSIYLVSDHGILWKHKSELIPIPSESPKHTYLRYYSTKLNSPRGFCFHNSGKNVTSLIYPFITRKMRSNEWGVHGGVSLEESIVPFLDWKIQ